MNTWTPTRRDNRGFTLIEIMIVVGIAAIMMATAIPFVGRALNKQPIVKATDDVLEALGHARAQAILHGTATSCRISPQAGVLRTMRAAPKQNAEDELYLDPEASAAAAAKKDFVFTATLDSEVRFEMVDVNGVEYLDAEQVDVTFYPNGTCDELILVFQKDNDKWRMIKLDIITGLADFETDYRKYEDFVRH